MSDNIPYTNKSTFINAVQANKSLTADGKEIILGDTVYQLSKIEGTNRLILKEFNVQSKLSDGRIAVHSEQMLGTTKNTLNLKVAPNTLYKDPVALVMGVLTDVIYKQEIELPQTRKSLEEILKGFGKLSEGGGIIVGDSEEEI